MTTYKPLVLIAGLDQQLSNSDALDVSTFDTATVNFTGNLDVTGNVTCNNLTTNTPIDHSALSNLSADDHTQYILADGTRDFTGTVNGVTPTANAHLATKAYVDANDSDTTNHSLLTNLSADDHTQYILADGTRAFTGTVNGVTPTANAHLATKGYVDANDSDTTNHSLLTNLSADDHTQYILADGTRAFTGTVNGVTPTANAHLATKAYVDANDSDTTNHSALSNLSADDHTQYILADGTRAFTGTVNGVTPTANAHLATKAYVDANGTTNHSLLTNLSADDHPQYVLADGTRAFTGTVNGVTPTANAHLATKAYVDANDSDTTNHSLLTNLSADDHTQYILADGTRAFTGTVNGVTPTANAHLATKAYVDANDSDTTNHSLLTNLSADDHPQYVLADGTRAFTGTVNGVTPTINEHLATKGYVDANDSDTTNHSLLTNLSADDHTQYTLADGSRAFSTNNGAIGLVLWDTGNNSLDTTNRGGSVIIGGYTNAINGRNSTIIAGYINSITSNVDNSAIIGGGSHTINKSHSAILGGWDNSITGNYAGILSGQGNEANEEYSVAHGKYAVADIYGAQAQASSRIGVSGDVQTMVCTLVLNDGSGNYTEMFLDSNGATHGTKQLLVPPNTAWAIKALLCGLATNGYAMAAYEWRAGVKRDGTATAAFSGTPTRTIISEDDITWDTDMTIDTTTNAVQIKVKGTAGWYINWCARVEITQVKVQS